MSPAVLLVASVILVLLALAAVFSAAETAMTAASRARLHQLERDGDRAAQRVNRLIERQSLMIGSLLLGNNLINILASALITEALAHSIPGAWGVAVSTIVTTALVLIFAEVLPKTLAIGRPEEAARALSLPVAVVVRLFGPLVRAIQWVIVGGLRLAGVEVEPQPDAAVAQEEIRGAVEYHHAEGLVESRDRQMLGGVLDLSDLSVGDVMVHRKSITLLDADLPPRTLIAEALASPYTRLPMYRDDPENIVGVLHGKDLARAITLADGRVDALDIAAVASEPWFIPDTTNLKDQLNAFLKRRSHFALIVDEYGALQGLVTLEDILEEIVGEIEDEHDAEVAGVAPQPDGSVIVDGVVTIRDLNRALDWTLPDDEWVSVAGLVLHEAQAIPEPGQTFIFHDHRFQVLGRQRNQITSLRVSAPLKGDD